MDSGSTALLALALTLSSGIHAEAACETPDFSGTAKQRKGLFEELLRDTLAQEAFFAPAQETLRLEFEEEARAMRTAFLRADHEQSLYHTLIRFSNLRRNSQLRVRMVSGGLRVTVDIQETPVRFGLDVGSAPDYQLFLRDHDVDIQRKLNSISPRSAKVEYGDRLIQVHGKPIRDTLDKMQPYLRYSTTEQLWTAFANYLSKKRYDFDPSVFKHNDVTFTLEKPDGKRYKLRVPFIDDTGTIKWAMARSRRDYGDFRVAMATESFVVHRPSPGRPVIALIVECLSFGETTDEDVAKLRAYAAEEQLLEHAVLWDLTRARGTEVPWSLIQTLAPKPFRVTHSRLHLGERTSAFIEDTLATASPNVAAWLQTEVRAALERGDATTTPVPHRLEALPHDSDGVLAPAGVHFRGTTILLMGKSSSPSVDHLAAMWIDNRLGPSIGVPAPGIANGWEWKKPISLPRSERPLVDFVWNLGHVVRPNGEDLQGNPARPDELFAITPDNLPRWHAKLVRRALEMVEGL